MRNRALLALAVVVLVVGCSVVDSDQVNPDTVYMTWSGQYDEDQARVEWRATYFVGGSDGTYLELTGRSGSSVNGEEMVSQRGIFNTIDYVWSRVFSSLSGPDRSYRIDYIDTSGKDYSNQVELPPQTSLDASQPLRLSLSGGAYAVRWRSAETLGGRDTLQATLSMTGLTINVYEEDPAGSSGAISFTPEQLRQLRPGSARLRVCLSREASLLEVPPKGGTLSTSYCSSSVGVRVDP